MATRHEIFEVLRSVSSTLYGAEEGRQIAEMILESRGITRNKLIVEPELELPFPDLDDILEQIKTWRPVQYITGYTEFADMELKVSEGVLIPRPETEELVEWIASNHKHDADILDVGTGSGCIAIALSRAIDDSRVWAMDISSEALDIARQNGARYAPHVQFIEGDALSDFSTLFCNAFDVIVSNPPYIPISDKGAMRPNVTEHEPHGALFVPDDDPLLFYRAIAHTAHKMLKNEGALYFEIYELLAEEMRAMLYEEGYGDITLREDFRGKPRMICARKERV